MPYAHDASEPIGRVLLLGPGGLLGRAFAGAFAAHHIPFHSLGRDGLDLADLDAIDRLDLSGCTHVVNCAAWRDADTAESHPDQARAVNTTAVARLAGRCAVAHARLVHISTDYVFAGDRRTPYAPNATPDAKSVYGRTKAEGDRLALQADPNTLVLRTSWVYAPWGRSFVGKIVQLLAERDALRVVNDQVGRPTSAEAFVRSAIALMRRRASGVWNLCDGGEPCSWFDLASYVAELLDKKGAVSPCSTSEYTLPAHRPPYSVLCMKQTEQTLGPLTPWRFGVADTLRRLSDAPLGGAAHGAPHSESTSRIGAVSS